MKTLEQLYEEIQVDSELKKECVKATEDKKIVDFLKSHDCDTTEAELEAFISSKKNNKELSDDELDMVSGGDCTTYNHGDHGRPVVTAVNSCNLWTCEDCDATSPCHCNDGRGRDICNCGNCRYSRYVDLLLQCYHPDRYKYE